MNDNSNNRQKSSQKRKSWGFAFFGGTPEIETEATDKVEFASEFAELESAVEQIFPLTTTKVGDRIRVVGFRGKDGINRLLSLGLIPGAEVEVISCTPGGSVIVGFGGSRLGLGAGMAHRVIVTDNLAYTNKSEKVGQKSTQASIHLRDVPIGARGRVVGYEKSLRSYKGKLLSMGLTPGTEFTVIRHAPLGDPVEIEVRGFKLSLRKHEADALCVEEVANA